MMRAGSRFRLTGASAERAHENYKPRDDRDGNQQFNYEQDVAKMRPDHPAPSFVGDMKSTMVVVIRPMVRGPVRSTFRQ